MPKLEALKRGRPSTLPEPWASMAKHAGGVEQLAKRLGVAQNTLYRWAHGQRKVSGSARILLDMLANEIGKV